MPQATPQAVKTLTSSAIMAEGSGKSDWILVVGSNPDCLKIDRQKRSKLEDKFYYKIGRIPEDAGSLVFYVGEEVEEENLPGNYTEHSSCPASAVSINLQRFGKCNDVYCLLDERGEMPAPEERFRMKTMVRVNKLTVEKILDAIAYVEHAVKRLGRSQNKVTSQ